MKKKIIILSIILSLFAGAAYAKYATVYHPTTGERKMVIVGDPNAFRGGFVLEAKSLGSFSPSTGYKSKLTSSITTTATTVYVANVNDINGIVLPCSTTNKCYFNIEPGAAHQEPILCTGVSTNSFIGCVRGLAATGNTETASTTLQYAHNAGSIIIMTNISQFYGNFMDLWSNQTATGTKTFVSYPQIQTYVAPTLNTQFAPKKYIDDTVIVGAPAATEITAGIGKIATKSQAAAGTSGDGTYYYLLTSNIATSSSDVATTSVPITKTNGKIDKSFLDSNLTFSGTTTLSNITIGNTVMAMIASTTINGAVTPVPVYIASSSLLNAGTVLPCAANNETKFDFIGFAITNAQNGEIVYVQTAGIVSGFTSLTTGKRYFVQDTAGQIATTTGTYYLQVGIAKSATELFIDKGIGVFGNIGLRPSTTVMGASNDTEICSSVGGGPVPKKEIQMLFPFSASSTIVVSFEMVYTPGADMAVGQIYINSVAVGAQYQSNSTSYITYTQTFTPISPKDIIQLRGYNSGGGQSCWKNLRFYYDKYIIPDTFNKNY